MNINSITTCAATLMPGVAETIERRTGQTNVVIARNAVYLGVVLTALSTAEVLYPREEGATKRTLYGIATLAGVGLTTVAANHLFRSVCR